MKYQSTRSSFSTDSLNAVLMGPAPDGGLFTDPQMLKPGYIGFDWKSCLEMDTIGMSKKILSTLLPDFKDMDSLVEKAYRGRFETDDLTPLVKVDNAWVLELFRGPTSAFKDVALSILPRLMTAAVKQSGEEKQILILTATSGDTGKAALEGFHDVDGIRIIVFYPHNGVSLVQKSQMTTQEGSNVLVCAVRGNFDDCQTGVKKAFAGIRDYCAQNGWQLSSANSINIGRLAPQTVYYFAAYRDLVKNGAIKVGDPVDFCVPTGNFGDILAGYWAKLMGLPVGKLICASNSNRILTDFFTTGVYDTRREFYKTSSPSMDILVSSNLERLLWLAMDGDSEKVSHLMKQLSETGIYKLDGATMDRLRKDFAADCCTEEEGAASIKAVWEKNRYLMDPHTAVAWTCARRALEKDSSRPMVVLSTASPYKFPHSVLAALGKETGGDEFTLMENLHNITGVPVPPNLSGLKDKKSRFSTVIDVDDISAYVKESL